MDFDERKVTAASSGERHGSRPDFPAEPQGRKHGKIGRPPNSSKNGIPRHSPSSTLPTVPNAQTTPHPSAPAYPDHAVYPNHASQNASRQLSPPPYAHPFQGHGQPHYNYPQGASQVTPTEGSRVKLKKIRLSQSTNNSLSSPSAPIPSPAFTPGSVPHTALSPIPQHTSLQQTLSHTKSDHMDETSFSNTPRLHDNQSSRGEIRKRKQQEHAYPTSRHIDFQESGAEKKTTDHIEVIRGRPPSIKAPSFVYSPLKTYPDLAKHLNSNVKFKIQSSYLVASSQQITKRTLWGTGIYTEDSDLVAALAHSGHFIPGYNPPPFSGLQVVVRILPAQQKYLASFSNGIMSRKWGSFHGISMRIEKVYVIEEKKSAPLTSYQLVPLANIVSKNDMRKASDRLQRILQKSNNLEGSNVPFVSLYFNKDNEPCPAYNVAILSDRGIQPEQMTSARFSSHVMFIETNTNQRYELSLETELPPSEEPPSTTKQTGEAMQDDSNPPIAQTTTPNDPKNAPKRDTSVSSLKKSSSLYRLALVTDTKVCGIQGLKQVSVPLSSEHVQVVESGLRWHEIEWGNQSVSVKGTEYAIVTYMWHSLNDRTNRIF